MRNKSNVKNRNSKSLQPLPSYGIVIQSHHHSQDFHTIEHRHPYHSMLYIVSGKGICFIDNRSHKVMPNTAVILKKGRPHKLIDKSGNPMVVFVVYFSDKIAQADEDIFYPLLRSGKSVLIPAHQALHIRKYLRQMLHEQNNRPVKFKTAIRQCLSAIILEIYRANIRKDKASHRLTGTSTARVEKVLEYIAERCYEQQSLSAAARMAHISQRQFSNLCRKITNKSFVEYVNTTRLNKAKELLLNTEMPVSAIAFEVGFEEISTFYRAFAKHYKVPPLTFRK